jgi:hypothetical protein
LKWKELFFSLCARRGHQSLTAFGAKTLNYNTVSVKSARAMWKVLMVQSCDNDILEGLAVANPPQTQNPLFFSWRDWRL